MGKDVTDLGVSVSFMGRSSDAFGSKCDTCGTEDFD